MLMLNCSRVYTKTFLTRSISQHGKPILSQIRADPSSDSATGSKASKTSTVTKSPLIQKEKSTPQGSIEINLDNANILTRAHAKLPERQPLVKNFFVAEIDREMLAYPEVLDKDELDRIVSVLRPVTNYFAAKEPASNPTQLFKDTKDFKLLEGSVPEQYGGKSHFSTETLLCTEAESVNAADSLIFNAHRLVIAVLSDHGTKAQQEKYLPKLGKGEWIGSVAIAEENADPVNVLTKAEVADNDSDWILNGEKDCVINAEKSNFLIVMAETNVRDFLGDTTDTLTAFLVDPRQPGVTIHPAEETIGCNSVPHTKVSFKNVQVSGSNVIDEPGKGNIILQKILFTSRLQTSIINVTQMKKILNFFIQQSINTEFSKAKLLELNVVRRAIADAACSIYAIESMIYMTASIPDLYEKPDIDLESAIVKVFSQKKLLELATLALDFLGSGVVTKGHMIETSIRDAVQLQAFGEPNEMLKLYIGTTGLMHCGRFHYDDIKKNRNPLFNPDYVMRKVFKGEGMRNIQTRLDLIEHLHPSFDVAALHLEQAICRLRLGSDILLANHGNNVMSKHPDVLRLSESAMEIYALFCSLSRASRAYCIGLRHADYDRLVATCVAHTTSEKVLYLMTEIEKGEIFSYDTHFDKVAEQLFFCKEYFAEHPLARNF